MRQPASLFSKLLSTSTRLLWIDGSIFVWRPDFDQTARAVEPIPLELAHTLLTAFARSVCHRCRLCASSTPRALSAARLILPDIVIAVATMHDLAVRNSPNCQ